MCPRLNGFCCSCRQLYAMITEADDHEEVQEYADLVGPVVSSRMLLIRSG